MPRVPAPIHRSFRAMLASVIFSLILSVFPSQIRCDTDNRSLSVTSGEQMEAVFEEFSEVGLELGHPLRVKGLTLNRDALELTLHDGVLYLSRPLAGVVSGALFVGAGRMKVTPHGILEREALERKYGKGTIDEPFDRAVLRFNDETGKELVAAATEAAPSDIDARDIWAGRNRILRASDDLQVDFLEGVLSGLPGREFFVAEVRTRGRGWLNYNYRGRRRIEVTLFHVRPGGAAGLRLYDPWCSFHKRDDYDRDGRYSLDPDDDTKEPAALRHVAMTLEIRDKKTVTVDAVVTVEARENDVRAIRFSLVNNLGGASWEDSGRRVELDLVESADGSPLEYIHKWHQLLVLLPRPLAQGEKIDIRVRATENTIIQLTPKSYWIYTTYAWFPQIGFNGGRYTFDWIVKVARPMTAVGSGELVREWSEDGMNCGRWRSTSPVHFASFIFGEFRVTESVYRRDGADDIPLRIYSIRGDRVGVKTKKENILHNVIQGLRNFETIFGPYPYSDLDIAQMEPSLGFAQSPAGILLLNRVIGDAGGGGRGDQVIFHELAHQWWGNQVGWVGPEDDWISESWAEYGAGLITEGIDPERFTDMRREWKRDARRVDSIASIAAAYTSPDARTGLLYSKGPYVVHMLRTWLGWERFTQLTLRLQTKYSGMEIDTNTISREASVIMGYDMSPFFDQWVRARGIPIVKYSWTAESAPDGTWLVTVHARQQDPENFKLMRVPITFDLGETDPVVVMRPLLEDDVTLRFRVPAPPVAVLMDADETQLADFVLEKP